MTKCTRAVPGILTTGLLLMAAACSTGGADPEDLARTMVAQTAAAASPTPAPTDTPNPTETPVPTVTPTDTPEPTATQTETPAPPTATPTETPLPGPVSFSDDFSAASDAWAQCEVCDWDDGKLFLGPYPATNQDLAFYTICESCGTPTYYRMGVDATYVEGPTDRGYGLLILLRDGELLDLEISTFQTAILWRYNLHTETWEFVDGAFTGLLRPSYGTNRLEVEVRPSSAGKADIFININGRNWKVLFGQPAEPAQVGLLVGLHSIGVAFDNFEFEEIE